MKTSPSYPNRHPNWIDVDPDPAFEKNKLRARLVSVAAPKTTLFAPPPNKPGKAALKEKFLTAKNTAPHTKSDDEVQERIPLSTSPQPVVAENTPSPAPAKPVAATPPPALVSEYTLSSGNNFYAVSRRLQVSYNELMEANGITDPRQLRIGQKLKVPARRNDTTCAL